MKDELDSEAKLAEAEFRNLVFANNPDLYKRIFIDVQKADEDAVEWKRPQTLGDMQQMVAELRDAGLDLDFDMSEEMTDFSRFDTTSDDEEDPEPDLPHSEGSAGHVDFFDALHTDDTAQPED